jgi:tight adherence protein B
MGETITILGLAWGLGFIGYAWRQARLRDQVRARMASTHVVPTAEPAEAPIEDRPFARRHPFVPWIVATVVIAVLHGILQLDLVISLALGAMVGFLGGLIDGMWLSRQEALIEQQLSAAIDLMVGALYAGASVPSAVEIALRETKKPLAIQLEEVLGRLRYGDDPATVFRGLARRVPLDNFRLFSTSLAVHWEVGGSLAPTLSTVGRTIRDRIEIARRIRSMTTQSRVSTIAVLGTTYFLGVLMWRNDPARMEEFLTNSVGKALVAGALVLEAVGIVWAAHIGKVKF